MPRDHIALEKMLLRRDAEILNHCAHIDIEGNLIVTSNPRSFMNRRVESSSSSVGSYYNDDDAYDDQLFEEEGPKA
jgi:hypothetical protein